MTRLDTHSKLNRRHRVYVCVCTPQYSCMHRHTIPCHRFNLLWVSSLKLWEALTPKKKFIIFGSINQINCVPTNYCWENWDHVHMNVKLTVAFNFITLNYSAVAHSFQIEHQELPRRLPLNCWNLSHSNGFQRPTNATPSIYGPCFCTIVFIRICTIQLESLQTVSKLSVCVTREKVRKGGRRNYTYRLCTI